MTSKNELIFASDGKVLVEAARDTISRFLRVKKLITPTALSSESKVEQKLGCFVTLKDVRNKNALRGCIGFPEPVYKLSKALPLAAVYAATEDPRFPAVSLSELENLTLEISILTKPERINVRNQHELPQNIEIGRDGLIMKWSFGSGLLLPQVATEMRLNAVEFLENLGLKAGAPSNQWLDPATVISKFQAIVFQELRPNGEVVLSSESVRR
jgi:uncharacterized protein (TIGR00296 family)